MHRVLLILLIMVVCAAAVPAAHAQEQQAGTQLKFENVDEIRNRPSDIHISSDPEYRPGLEEEYGGSDETGYKKEEVEPDQEYIQEKTYYRRVDDKKRSRPASRWN